MTQQGKAGAAGILQRLRDSRNRKKQPDSKTPPTDVAFAQKIAADLKKQEESAQGPQKPAIVRTDGGMIRAEVIADAITAACAQHGVPLPFGGVLPVFAQIDGQDARLFSLRVPEGCTGPEVAKVLIICEGTHRIKRKTAQGFVLEEI
jgi:hypothetical protein